MHACIAYASINRDVEYIEESIQTEREGKWNKRIMYYDIIGDCRTMSLGDVRRAFNIAMTTWDIEIAIEFKSSWSGGEYHKPDIRLDFQGKDEYNLFKIKPSVLAVAYYPNQGDISGLMIFNNDYIWSRSGKSITGKKAKELGFVDQAGDTTQLRVFNLSVTLTHELGHMLGLKHDEEKGSYDVMDPYYNGMTQLSKNDIRRILLKYTARVYRRFRGYARLKKWLIRVHKRL